MAEAKRSRRRGHGEGTIYRKPDGRWCAQVRMGRDPLSGKPIRETLYADSQKELIEKVTKKREEATRGLVTSTTRLTVNGMLNLWLDSVKMHTREETALRYKQELAHIRPALGTLQVKELSAFAINSALLALAESGVGTAKPKRALARLRQALGWAQGLGIVSHNMAKAVKLPKHQPEEKHPLTAEQAAKLLATTRAAGDRQHALYVTALDTGARQGELLALTWEDWNPTTRELRLFRALRNLSGRTFIKDNKTRSSKRTVKVSTATAAALEGHREQMRAEGHGSQLMFPAERGGYQQASNLFNRSFLPALQRAGLPRIRFHDLRHTAATLLLSRGVNVKLVSARLGHSSPVVTLNHYAHVIPEAADQAATIMGELLGPSSSKMAANGAQDYCI
jgi:integrase